MPLPLVNWPRNHKCTLRMAIHASKLFRNKFCFTRRSKNGDTVHIHRQNIKFTSESHFQIVLKCRIAEFFPDPKMGYSIRETPNVKIVKIRVSNPLAFLFHCNCIDPRYKAQLIYVLFCLSTKFAIYRSPG